MLCVKRLDQLCGLIRTPQLTGLVICACGSPQPYIYHHKNIACTRSSPRSELSIWPLFRKQYRNCQSCAPSLSPNYSRIIILSASTLLFATFFISSPRQPTSPALSYLMRSRWIIARQGIHTQCQSPPSASGHMDISLISTSFSHKTHGLFARPLN